jgi:hypothetical protein
VIEIKPVGVKQTEFKVDERRFVRLFRDLMKGSSPGGSLQDMFLAFCLKRYAGSYFVRMEVLRSTILNNLSLIWINVL